MINSLITKNGVTFKELEKNIFSWYTRQNNSLPKNS